MAIVYIAVLEHGGDDGRGLYREPKYRGFYEEDDAERYAAVRGGCDVVSVEILDGHEAKDLIEAEAKERKDDERMREAGL